MNVKWNESEREYIRQNAGIMSDTDIAAKLCKITDRHVSVEAVRKQRQKMKIKKQPGRGVCKLQQEETVKKPAGMHISGAEPGDIPQ